MKDQTRNQGKGKPDRYTDYLFTKKEYEAYKLFETGRPVPKTELIETIFGDTTAEGRGIRNLILRVRRKIEPKHTIRLVRDARDLQGPSEWQLVENTEKVAEKRKLANTKVLPPQSARHKQLYPNYAYGRR